MAHLGVVVNPTAGNNRASAVTQAVLAAIDRRGHDVLDLSADSADAALTGAQEACHRGLDGLVVVGGDGMVHLGANATAGTGVPLGVVALGSGNDFARAAGLPVHRGRASLDLIDAALEGGGRAIDVLVSTSERGSERTVCVLSAGLDAAVNARANQYSFPPGGGKYIRAVYSELRRYRPYGYRLTIDGEQRDLAGTLVAVANTPYFGGGMKIAPGAVMDDGLADVVIGSGLTVPQVLAVFPRLYEGTHLRHPAVEVVRAASLRIEPWSEHPAPPAPMGDGEPVGLLPLDITVAPGGLTLLAPPVP